VARNLRERKFPLRSVAAEDAKPIPKLGTCPPGYHGSGKYCVPRERAKPAIEKLGACPPDYYSNGGYCVGGYNPKTVIE